MTIVTKTVGELITALSKYKCDQLVVIKRGIGDPCDTCGCQDQEDCSVSVVDLETVIVLEAY